MSSIMSAIVSDIFKDKGSQALLEVILRSLLKDKKVVCWYISYTSFIHLIVLFCCKSFSVIVMASSFSFTRAMCNYLFL